MSYKSGYWTVRRAAEWLDCNEKTIWRGIRAGRLKAVKIGRTYRTTKPWLLQWLNVKLEGPWGRPADWRSPEAASDKPAAIGSMPPSTKSVN